MAEENIVLKGSLKYREGKKWKTRWCIIKKLSPVADRLHIALYKDASECLKSGHEKANIPLENFCGIESGFVVDRERHVMALICQRQVVLLAFPSQDMLTVWKNRIRAHLGEDYQYCVKLLKVPMEVKMPQGAVKLLIQGQTLCVTVGTPPRLLGAWNVADLRRFGPVDDKFCFEGGSRCGKGEGLYVFKTEQAESSQIQELLQRASRVRAKPPPFHRHNSKGNLSCTSVETSASSGSPCRQPHTHDFRNSEAYSGSQYSSRNGSNGSTCSEDTSTVRNSESRSTIRNTSSPRSSIVCTSQVNSIHIPTDRCTHGNNNLKLSADYTNRTSCDVIQSCPIPRRFSCGDLGLCRRIQEWTIRDSNETDTKIYNKTKNRPLSDIGFCMEGRQDGFRQLDTGMQHNVFEASSSYAAVGRNIEVLSPKISKFERCLSAASSGSSRGSGSCALASHGQAGSGSMDLLDEVMKACRLEDFSGSSNTTSSCSSTRDLTDISLSCGVGSLHGRESTAKSHEQTKCSNKLSEYKSQSSAMKSNNRSQYSQAQSDRGSPEVALAAEYMNLSVSNTRHCSKQPRTDVTVASTRSMPAGVHGMHSLSAAESSQSSTSLQPSHVANATSSSISSQSSRSQAPVVTTSLPVSRSPNIAQTRRSPDATNVEPTANFQQPLPHVDLGHFDGNDEGYLYWVKVDPQSIVPRLEPVHNARSGLATNRSTATKTTGVAVSGRPVEYVNLNPQTKPPPHSQRNRAVLSYHGSLQRPHKYQPARGASSYSAEQRQDLAGTYIALRKNANQGSPTLARPRGKSMEDVFSGFSNSTVDGETTVRMQARDSRNNIIPSLHRFVPPPFDPAPAVPYRNSRTSINSNKASNPIPVVTCSINPCTRTEAPPITSGPHCIAVSTPSGTKYRDSDYMLMKPSGNEKDDCTIFCTVDLPQRALASEASPRTRTRNWSFTETSSSGKSNSDGAATRMSHSADPAYMDMSVGRKPADKKFNRSFSMRENSTSKPKLHHSRSLEDELESNHSNGSDYGNYMPMAPEQTGQPEGSPGTLAKPFENLIEPKHYTKKTAKPQVPPQIPTVSSSNGQSDKSAKTNSDDNSWKSSMPSLKASGLLSRLIRRSSSKEGKLSKSQEDMLSCDEDLSNQALLLEQFESTKQTATDSSVNKDEATSGVNPVTRASSFTSSSDHGDSAPKPHARVVACGGTIPRRASMGVLQCGGECPERQRSMSIPSHTWLQDLPHSNKYACDNLLYAVPPVHSALVGAPPLPPRTYRNRYPKGQNSYPRPPPPTSHSRRPLQPLSTIPGDSELVTQTPATVSQPVISFVAEVPPLPQKIYRCVRNNWCLLEKEYAKHAQQRADGSTAESKTDLAERSQPLPSDDSEELSTPVFTLSADDELSPPPPRRRSLTLDIAALQEYEDQNQEQMTGPGIVRPPSSKGSVDPDCESPSMVSCSSSDTHSLCSGDDRNSSPAATTLRPRFGKEYQKLDRKKLAEELNVHLEPQPEKSPSVTSSVFTFDVSSVGSNRMSPVSGHSSGNNSPRSPSISSRQTYHPEYANLTFHRHYSPSASPVSLSAFSDPFSPLINYAEIDLSSSDGSGRPRRMPNKESRIVYAEIDRVATAAASRVGKEHAQLREDTLRRSDSRTRANGDKEYYKRGKGKGVDKAKNADKKSLSRSGSSAKDKKTSNT